MNTARGAGSEHASPRRWIFVRHSLSQLDPETRASRWDLSPEGRRRAEGLAQVLLGRGVRAPVLASPEPKAWGTGSILSEVLGVELREESKLGEHRADAVPIMDPAAFARKVERWLETEGKEPLVRHGPDEETWRELQSRSLAVFEENRAGSERELIMVTHGRWLAAAIPQRVGLASRARFWRGLTLPAVVSLLVPDRSPVGNPSFELESILTLGDDGDWIHDDAPVAHLS